jgi:hypothetical protein
MKLKIILAAIGDKWPIAARIAMGLNALVILAEIMVFVTTKKLKKQK